MPAYLMGKMGNCPGPRAQGGPAPAEELLKIKEKGVKREKGQKRGKKGKKEIK